MGYRSELVADAFWTAAGGRLSFGTPADIERAAPRAFPVAVIRVANLDTDYVANFLARIGADPWNGGPPRQLRGCLIADVGAALILVDGNDPEDEQRMTIAHEIAHLLLHYLRPREHAVTAFGSSILAVLDRTRPPTPAERFSSALRDVPIEPFRHAMDRQQPSSSGQVAQIEDEADDLAIELLAPTKLLRSLNSVSPGAIRDQFGLPAPVAARLARLVGPPITSPGVLGLFRKK